MKRKYDFRLFAPEGTPTGTEVVTPPAEGATPATPEGGAPPEPTPSLLSQATGGTSETPPAEGTETPPAEGESSQGAEGGAGEPLDVSALTLPEGFELPEEVGAAFAEVLNDPNLSRQELGQKLIDMQIEQAKAASAAMSEASTSVWNEMNQNWRTELAALPEFKNTDKALGDIKTVLMGMGAGDDFFKALDITGAGNNPQIMLMLQKLTAPHVEGEAVSSTPVKSAAANPALTMYPTMKQ